MLVVEKVLGNVQTDPSLSAEHQEWRRAGNVEVVELTPLEAQKIRQRTISNKGSRLGINLDRGTVLRDGDVLYRDSCEARMILVHLKPEGVLRITLLPTVSEAELIDFAVRLGHMLGNQHWPVKIDDRTIYVPVSVDKRVMETVLKTYNLPGIIYAFEAHAVGAILPLQPTAHLRNHEHSHPHDHE